MWGAETSESSNDDYSRAIFAAGCFWCIQIEYDNVPGVIKTTVGYTGGQTQNPTYQQVTKGDTGHYEAVEVVYDPSEVDYKTLLQYFWVNVDPFDGGGQFCDRGHSYKSVIFYQNETEKQQALASKKSISEAFGTTVQTEVLPASVFYPAEEYHQSYYKKNPLSYKFYRFRCKRDDRLMQVWDTFDVTRIKYD